jgi:RNA polymerase sigma factor (sigma-70 family)
VDERKAAEGAAVQDLAELPTRRYDSSTEGNEDNEGLRLLVWIRFHPRDTTTALPCFVSFVAFCSPHFGNFLFGFLPRRRFNSKLTMTDTRQLLRQYADDGSEPAFRELVTRYVNLVYSTARRLTGGDSHLAEDVTQIVFTDLARKARSLSTEVMLGGWLHQRTFHVATTLIRADRRRQDRERRAVEMNLLQDPSGNPLAQITPVLDEAIIELSAEDRQAILLRFFEQREFRLVGEAMGVNEDAARMRVNRAVEKLHSLLQRRGVTLSAAALGSVLAADAVTAAPAALALTISNTALAAAGTGTTLTLLKLFTMTKLQTAVVGAVVLAGVATPLAVQYQANARLREREEALHQQTDRAAQLESENQRLSNQIAVVTTPTDPSGEVLRLRGELARLRADSEELTRMKAAAQKKDPANRASLIRQRLDQMPEKKIPELQFLNDAEWQQVASIPDNLETDEDFLVAFSRARQRAKDLFVHWLGQALHNYAKANDGMLPTDLSQLKPYFTPPVYDANWKPGDPKRYELLAVDDAVLQRYQLMQSGKLSDVPQVGTYPPIEVTGKPDQDARTAERREKMKTNLPWTEPVVVEKGPVDQIYDSLFTVTAYGYSYRNFGRGTGSGSGTFAKGQVGTNGVPEMVDPPAAQGRNAIAGGSFGGGSGSGGGGFGGGGAGPVGN